MNRRGQGQVLGRAVQPGNGSPADGEGPGMGGGAERGGGRGGARRAGSVTTLWAEHVVKHCQAWQSAITLGHNVGS